MVPSRSAAARAEAAARAAVAAAWAEAAARAEAWQTEQLRFYLTKEG